MNAIVWPLVELSSRLLDREEREVVLGDLQETNENAWRAMLDVFGLVFRRQAGSLARSPPMACWICRRASLQLPPDDRFFFRELHVSAAGQSQGLSLALANGARGFPSAAVPHLPAHCLVLVSRLRSWIGFATNPLGECCSVGSSLLVFSVYVCLQPMLFTVPSARDLRRPPGMARLSHLVPRCL